MSIHRSVSGAPLAQFDANHANFPATAPAAAASRNAHPILAYDDGLEVANENVIFQGDMPADYAEGDIIVDIDWAAETAVIGDVTWCVEFERVAPAGQDIDVDGFAAQQPGTSTTSGASGIVTRTTITLTQAEADGIKAGDAYRLRLQRLTDDVGDDMVGDAQVLKVTVRQ